MALVFNESGRHICLGKYKQIRLWSSIQLRMKRVKAELTCVTNVCNVTVLPIYTYAICCPIAGYLGNPFSDGNWEMTALNFLYIIKHDSPPRHLLVRKYECYAIHGGFCADTGYMNSLRPNGGK